MGPMPTVMLGNVSPISLITDTETGEKTLYKHPGIHATVTDMLIRSESLFDAMRDVINLWAHSSDEAPVWVESDDPDLASALRKHFGCGERPSDWEMDIEHTAMVPVADKLIVPGASPDAPTAPGTIEVGGTN